MDSCEADVSIQLPEEDGKNELQTSPRVDVDEGQEHENSKDSSVGKSSESTDTECDCQNPSASSINKIQMEIHGEEYYTSGLSSAYKCEIDVVDGERESQTSEVPSSAVFGGGIVVKDEEVTYVIPTVGMEFETEDHAYKCYSRYAVLEGFSIRKDFLNKSRINGVVVSRRYTCYRQGYRPTKDCANLRKPRQETRTGCLAHMTIARQPNGVFRVTHFETKHNHEFVTQSTAHMLPSQKRLSFAQAVEADLSNSSRMDGIPKLGMGFDSEDHAYEYYNAYAGQVGFSVRKDYVNRSKIDGAVASRRFTCFREGFRQKDKRDLNVKRSRKETRIGCLAQLVISRQADGKYRVTHFEEKHNHELVAACRVRMLRSQKRLAVSQVVEGNVQVVSENQPKSTTKLSQNSAGNELGYNPMDYKSKLSSKRTREMQVGEAERIQQYFQSKQLKNPSFIYTMQLDSEDQITNIFWTDAKMLVDYSDFGDVVFFDTTYKLIRDGRAFCPFLGVNHHKQVVIFGAALLYDDSAESFKWLFRTFIEVMSGKKPKTILTDQDAVLVEAINSAFPETNHRICVWHLYQKVLKQFSHLFAGSDSFVNDLFSCFFDHEEEEDFIKAWKVMLDVYGLWENEWLNEIFIDREKWAIAYRRNIFCADIRTAQLREYFTSNLRKRLRSDSDVISLFKHIGKMVNDWHYKELEANYDMSQHMPRLIGDVILLKHARGVYAPKIFELFQQEYETSLNIVVNQCTENGSLFKYKVSIYGQLREYAVTYNLFDETVICSCMKYEFMGVLCSHALKVLDYRNIKVLPSHYILKRWTRNARV